MIKITLNGELRETTSSTIQELLEELKLHERRVAVMVDEEIVRRSDYSARGLEPLAHVEIISLIGGG